MKEKLYKIRNLLSLYGDGSSYSQIPAADAVPALDEAIAYIEELELRNKELMRPICQKTEKSQ